MPEQTRWVTCPRCSGWIGPDATFCRECGEPRPSTRSRRPWLWAAAGGAGLVVATAAVVVGLVLTSSPPPATAASSQTPSPTPNASTPAPSPTPSPTPEPVDAPASVTPLPSASVVPTSSPEPLEVAGLAAGESARVTEGGLNVRTRPGITYELVESFDPRDGSVIDDAVQLAAGDYVRIVNGPVLNDGFAWYKVFPIGYDPDSPAWRAVGWVAAGAGGTAWMTESEPPPPPADHPVGHGMPHAAHLVSRGSATSDDFVGAYPNIEWDATDADAGPCDLLVRFVDVETGEVQVVVEDTIGSAPEYGYWGSSELPLSTYRVEVDSTCSWAIVVYAWEA